MSPAALSPPLTRRRPASRRGSRVQLSAPNPRSARRGGAIASGRPLARYLDSEGRKRELVALDGHGGSVLVLDRDGATLCDRRLVAHLAADEPRENAMLVCHHYLQDANGRWCRGVRPEDLEIAPFAQDGGCDPKSAFDREDALVTDRQGNCYRLRSISYEGSIVQWRWSMRSAAACDDAWEPVSMREVVAALESYEPMRTLTERMLVHYRDNPSISVTRLRNEFDRLCSSPLVLNRGLREAVLDTIDRQATSMSEIALRCGVVKRDRRGKVSGETSWLARRIGVMPEGGEKTTTPWIHTDVLATIARKGLGVSPREVELQ
jgi:hypothetical protein